MNGFDTTQSAKVRRTRFLLQYQRLHSAGNSADSPTLQISQSANRLRAGLSHVEEWQQRQRELMPERAPAVNKQQRISKPRTRRRRARPQDSQRSPAAVLRTDRKRLRTTSQVNQPGTAAGCARTRNTRMPVVNETTSAVGNSFSFTNTSVPEAAQKCGELNMTTLPETCWAYASRRALASSRTAAAALGDSELDSQ